MADHRLIQLENIIEANQHKFYQTGKALKQIRDDRLFRDSFEAYVKDRWDMARSQAYRLITAAEVIDNLSPIGDGVLPQNEFQARVLTAKNIRKCTHPAKKAKSAKKTNTSTVDIISTDYKTAVMAMLEQIQTAQNDDWQATLFWLKVMKEKIIRYER